MSEPNNGAAPAAAPTLVITLSPDGQVSVAGQIDNKLFALGLIEVAKDAIIKHHDNAQKSNILAPPPGLRFGRS